MAEHTSPGRTGDSSVIGAAGTASVGVGAAVTAAVASACCTGPVVAPLVVAVLGAGGAAWAASLEPYAPLLLGVSALLLVYAFRAVHRGGVRGECRRDGDGGGSPTRLVLRGVVWLAALLWLVAAGLNLFLPAA